MKFLDRKEILWGEKIFFQDYSGGTLAFDVGIPKDDHRKELWCRVSGDDVKTNNEIRILRKFPISYR